MYIRQWLNEHAFADRSLVEVILTEPEFSDLRVYVGLASAFWSHLQSEPLIGSRSTLATMAAYLQLDQEEAKDEEARCSMDPFVWCDYLCLRRAASNDFQKLCVVEYIRKAGTLVSCIDGASPHCPMPPIKGLLIG